jgi:hypothetical protein
MSYVHGWFVREEVKGEGNLEGLRRDAETASSAASV